MIKSFSCAAAATAALLASFQPTSAQGSEPFIGELILFGTNWCPRGWAAANGQLLPINPNTALFSLLGTTFGGDGRTTFALPDLRGRAPVSFGQGPGLQDYRLGQPFGAETVTLNTTEIPSHNHTATSAGELHASSGSANTTSPSGAALATTQTPQYSSRGSVDEAMKEGSVTVSTTVGNTGGNQAHENRAPRLSMQWCIATVGIYPSRN